MESGFLWDLNHHSLGLKPSTLPISYQFLEFQPKFFWKWLLLPNCYKIAQKHFCIQLFSDLKQCGIIILTSTNLGLKFSPKFAFFLLGTRFVTKQSRYCEFISCKLKITYLLFYFTIWLFKREFKIWREIQAKNGSSQIDCPMVSRKSYLYY